jgi:cephalosporin-C deacetylase-like acetyl esterase
LTRRSLFLAIACLASCRAAEPVSFKALAAQFDYDASAPLNIHLTADQETGSGVHVMTLSYEGLHGPVSASLVLPSQPGKHPAVIFLHGLANKRDEFLADAILLAQVSPPAISFLIDAPPSRPVGMRRSWDPSAGDHDRGIHIQAVIDIRRGIDLLIARPDVDAKRIGYVGHGYGANWGAVLMSIEPRLRAFALIAGIVSLADVMHGDDPEWADLRYALGNQRYLAYLDSISLVDPIRYLGHSLGAPALLQFGRFDPYVSPEMAHRFAEATHPAPQVVFYDAGNDVNAPQALVDRSRFLSKHLGIGPVPWMRSGR